jgi:hypothetical protein
MVYVRPASERGYLFIGDVGWTLDNLKQLKLRPEVTMRAIISVRLSHYADRSIEWSCRSRGAQVHS